MFYGINFSIDHIVINIYNKIDTCLTIGTFASIVKYVPIHLFIVNVDLNCKVYKWYIFITDLRRDNLKNTLLICDSVNLIPYMRSTCRPNILIPLEGSICAISLKSDLTNC